MDESKETERHAVSRAPTLDSQASDRKVVYQRRRSRRSLGAAADHSEPHKTEEESSDRYMVVR